MRRNIIALLVICACSAGCMTDTKSKSNDHKTYTYDCSGLGQGWGDCTDQADKQCGPHNYSTVSQNGSPDAKGDGTTQMKRTLVVTCK
jgi:hypothetical protein